MSLWSKIENIDIQYQIPFSYSHRGHKLCRLPNGLIVLLISDPDDLSSVCSLTVATGSHNDPKGTPGVAHLCEHMLFAAGSKMYPDPNLYHKILAKNNGTHNAYTTGEQTTFFFEMSNINTNGELEFDLAMDIFSSFFTNPLFSTNLLNKELYVIQSEHDSNISNIDKIFYHGTRLLSYKEHPFHQFSTGDITSLSKISGSDLKSILIEYFNQNFFATNMTLVIKGPQSVNMLTKLAVTKFGNIKAYPFLQNRSKLGSLRKPHNTNIPRITKIKKSNILSRQWSKTYKATPCFKKNDPNVIIINSDKHPTIRFLFPVSNKDSIFSSKQIKVFGLIWCELFGDESIGSFYYNFKEKGWIDECIAYRSIFTTNDLGLTLEFSLTIVGTNHILDIIYGILENTKKLISKMYTKKIASLLYEFTLIDYINYLYKEEEISALEFCSNLSEFLQTDLSEIKLEYLFQMSPMLIDLNTEQIDDLSGVTDWWYKQAVSFQSFLKEFINANNLKILFLNVSVKNLTFMLLNKKQHFDTDPYYGFQYLLEKVSFKEIILQYSLQIADNYSNLYLSETNIFLPNYISKILCLKNLFRECSLRSRFSTLQLNLKLDSREEQKPCLINKSIFYEMWVSPLNDMYNHKDISSNNNQLRTNNNNKSIVSFELLSLNLTPSVTNTIYLEIFVIIIDLFLSYKLYPALKLGYTYEITASPEGQVKVSFTISGFNEGLPEIVKEITNTIKSLNNMNNDQLLSEKIFNNAKNTVEKKYIKALSDIPVKVASMGLLVVMERNMWTVEDRLEALANSNINQFKFFLNEFLQRSGNNTFLKLFVQSNNLYIVDKINFLLDNNLTHHLNMSQCDTPSEQKFISTARLSPGTNDYVEYLSQARDSNNSVVYFIQTGGRYDSYAYTLTKFTEYIMSLTLVPNLRYKKQIGYVVLGGMRILIDTIGIHVTVMSSSDPDTLEKQINQYLIFLETVILGQLTTKQFLIEFLEPFARMIEQEDNDSVQETSCGPRDLMTQIPADISHGPRDIINGRKLKDHCHIFNQIVHGDNTFAKGHQLVDRNVVKDLSKREYMKFFKEHLSPNSRRRCKISIWVRSPLHKEEITEKQLYLKIETFLKLKGFTIKQEDLKSLVAKSNGSPGTLMKLLLKYFSSRGETWKFCNALVKEFGQSVSQIVQQVGINRRLPSFVSADVTQYNVENISPLNQLESPKTYHKDGDFPHYWLKNYQKSRS
ncbi:Axl1p PWA37_000828 [Arxiozyma heterogenica]|uniref:Axl1p n=1 Tax=Arxiozyma heterogenica TaxID=278026 RepID=UPI002F1518DE